MTQTEYEAAVASLPQVPASSDEVLALEPNTAEKATSGPDPQVSSTTWVTWTKPDGDTFIAPLANAETYERKGFTRGGEEDIDDIQVYLAEAASKTAEPPAEPTEPSGG